MAHYVPISSENGRPSRPVSGLASIVCSIALLAAPGALAQTGANLATVLVEVQDQTGGAIEGASVVVRSAGTGATRQGSTDVRGQFTAAQVGGGEYEVRAEYRRFKPAAVWSRVAVGSVTQIRIALELETAIERADVKANGMQPVETSKTDVSQVVPEAALRDLPLNQRSFTALVTQQPGFVQMTNTPPLNPTSVIFSQGSQISANGSWTSAVAYLVDGVPINNAGYGAPGTAAAGDAPGVEAVQEFRVLAHDYSAAFGGAAGAVVSFATRSGSNGWHGSLYEYLRNNRLDARGPFDLLDVDGDGLADLPPFRRNQFGGTFGGPLRRDRTFFFANYEALRQRLTTTDTGTVPTLAARNGGVGGTSGFPVVGPILQPDGTYQRGPVAISPGVEAILELYPLPNGRDFGDGTAQYVFANRQPVRQDFGLIKVDHRLTPKDSVAVRYAATDASGVSALNLPTFQFTRDNRIQNLLLTWTRTVSPTTVNTLSVAFQRSNTLLATQPAQALKPEQFTGNPNRRAIGVIAVGAVSTAAAGGALSTLGTGTNLLHVAKNTFPIYDDLIYVRGNHLVKAGGMATRRQENWIRENYPGGNYNFRSVNDLLAANPADLTIAPDGANTGFGLRTTQLAWYLEDVWRLNRNITFTAGIRHEFQAPILGEVDDKIGNVKSLQDTGPTPGTPFNNYSLRQFEPRVGIAWDPLGSGQTVIRAGAGLFHSFLGYESFFEMFPNGPLPQLNRFSGEPLAPNRNQFRPIDFPVCNGCTLPGGRPTLLSGVLNPVHSPTSLQWHLEVARELYKGFAATATYVGSHSYHVPRSIAGNYNLPCRFEDGAPVFDGSCGKAAPQLSSSTVVLARVFDANASYHGLSLGVTRRYFSNLTISSSYTFAKALSESDASNGGAWLSDVAASSQYPADRKLDRSESVYSVRHRVTINGFYDLPFGRGKRLFGKARGLADALAGGWAIAGLGAFQSGFPFAVLAGFGITGVGDSGTPDRPNIVQYNAVLGRPDRWFDPRAYALQAPGHLGSAPRTSVRGPGFRNLDLSLLKTVRVSERVSGQLRFEFFNVLNHANFGLPSNRLYTGNVPQFNRTPSAAELQALPCRLTAAQAMLHSCNPQAGVISTAAGTARQIQLGLKLVF